MIAATDRDPQGRFAKGSPGGPGRPPRSVEQAYLEATFKSCSLARWRKIVKKAVSQAEEGCEKARMFLAKYLLGEKQTLEISTRGGGALPTHSRFDWSRLTAEEAGRATELFKIAESRVGMPFLEISRWTPDEMMEFSALLRKAKGAQDDDP